MQACNSDLAQTQLVSDVRPCLLRLSDSVMCAVRRTLTIYGDQCFAVAGPRVWNSLPTELRLDWIGLCSVLRPRQHSIGYMGDGFYRSKEVLKEDLQKTKQTTKTTKYTNGHT